MDDLKPCPFCGGTDCDAERELSSGRVHCYRCGADGPIVPYARDDKSWTWNTRTPDLAAEVLRLRAEVERLTDENAKLRAALECLPIADQMKILVAIGKETS